MPNLQSEKTKVLELDPKERSSTFEEVCLGYNKDEAINEAARCLNCKSPRCVAACPVGVAIPDFISKIASGDMEEAYNTLTKYNALPAVCGRVCPQEVQCEGACVRGLKGESVAIGKLERFVADTHRKQTHTKPQPTSLPANAPRVAVIGSGPSGLACAGELAGAGIAVTIFEAFHVAGGVLMYGIPEFRLPKEIVQSEVRQLEERGVRFELNAVIGRAETLDELLENGYDAIYIATGAGLPSFLGIPGEELPGVFSANEYLTRCNLMHAYDSRYETPMIRSKNVCVVGGGNVAMDAARCAKRLGAESVTVVYRRSEAELPARAEEVHHAKEEGIAFSMLTAPLEVLANENGQTSALKCARMELGEADESGRRKPVLVADSEFCIEADTVIIAIGTSPNPLLSQTTEGLSADKKGRLITTESTTATTKKGVFAGGDAVTGTATVILAMGAGKQGAQDILSYLSAEKKLS